MWLYLESQDPGVGIFISLRLKGEIFQGLCKLGSKGIFGWSLLLGIASIARSPESGGPT